MKSFETVECSWVNQATKREALNLGRVAKLMTLFRNGTSAREPKRHQTPLCCVVSIDLY